jgi:actin-like ATPase involved in cell morphogenesis
MQGKTHENIKRPLKDGVIADFDAEKMISLL